MMAMIPSSTLTFVILWFHEMQQVFGFITFSNEPMHTVRHLGRLAFQSSQSQLLGGQLWPGISPPPSAPGFCLKHKISSQHLHPSSSNSWFSSFLSKLILGISCFHRTLLFAECQVVILQSQLVQIYKQGQLDSVIYIPGAFSFCRGALDVMH